MAAVEALNAVGVALSANPSASHEQQTLGGNLTIAALVIQLVVIIIFICLAGVFHRKCTKANIHAKAVKTLLVTLYLSMALILMRCIYRLVEHTGDTKVDLGDLKSLKKLTPLLRYEVFFYIFEATFMFLNSILWNVWHPGRLLPKSIHIYLAQDGTEVEGEEDLDERSFLAKIANVLTFGMLFRKKKQTERFQELADYPATNRHADSASI
jgi:hypothetical protein